MENYQPNRVSGVSSKGSSPGGMGGMKSVWDEGAKREQGVNICAGVLRLDL